MRGLEYAGIGGCCEKNDPEEWSQHPCRESLCDGRLEVSCRITTSLFLETRLPRGGIASSLRLSTQDHSGCTTSWTSGSATSPDECLRKSSQREGRGRSLLRSTASKFVLVRPAITPSGFSLESGRHQGISLWRPCQHRSPENLSRRHWHKEPCKLSEAALCLARGPATNYWERKCYRCFRNYCTHCAPFMLVSQVFSCHTLAP